MQAFLAETRAALKLRAPGGRFGLATPVVSVAKWLGLWLALELALGWGRHTRFGAGLLGAVVPLLGVEAWLTTRRHWRARWLDTLALGVPVATLLSLGAALSGLSSYYASPWEKTLANLEFIADFLYFSAQATLPVFAVLVVLWTRSSSRAVRASYQRASVAAVLATLSYTFTFACILHALTALFEDADAVEHERAAIVR